MSLRKTNPKYTITYLFRRTSLKVIIMIDSRTRIGQCKKSNVFKVIDFDMSLVDLKKE